jgi:hypothetical protein
MIDEDSLRKRKAAMLPYLDERQRRLFAAAEDRMSGAILALEFDFRKINDLIGAMMLGNIHLIGSASLSVLFDLIGCASVIIHVDANEIGLGSWAECAGIGRRA